MIPQLPASIRRLTRATLVVPVTCPPACGPDPVTTAPAPAPEGWVKSPRNPILLLGNEMTPLPYKPKIAASMNSSPAI